MVPTLQVLQVDEEEWLSTCSKSEFIFNFKIWGDFKKKTCSKWIQYRCSHLKFNHLNCSNCMNNFLSSDWLQTEPEHFSCSCAAGRSVCHHCIAALYVLQHFHKCGFKTVPPNLSKTSMQQVFAYFAPPLSPTKYINTFRLGMCHPGMKDWLQGVWWTSPSKSLDGKKPLPKRGRGQQRVLPVPATML